MIEKMMTSEPWKIFAIPKAMQTDISMMKSARNVEATENGQYA
jgi:hypothetical protein